MNRRRVLNISAPDPILHPDDIIIDPRAGTISLARAEAERTDDEEIRALILEDAMHDDDMRERIASIVLERMAHRA